MIPLTTHLPPPGPFWSFNREERNAVAVLFALLLSDDNLRRFAALLEWEPPDVADAEVSVEWSYLRDLWNVHQHPNDPARARRAILDSLSPLSRDQLEQVDIVDFNSYFGAVPVPSATWIQSPGKWSVARFDTTIDDDEEFLSTCRFKWAFNIKPDLVLQTPSGQVLCIEAKWDSREGVYPATNAEKAIFKRRGLRPVTQTELQQYLVNELLGFDGTFAVLARDAVLTSAGRCVTWSELFRVLDLTGSPAWLRTWAEIETKP